MATRTASIYSEAKRQKNKGIHSKSKHSLNKKSKFYKKKYRGQGRP